VIIHEEGEAGHQMPDLERPVVAVSKAVNNLVKVNFKWSLDSHYNDLYSLAVIKSLFLKT